MWIRMVALCLTLLWGLTFTGLANAGPTGADRAPQWQALHSAVLNEDRAYRVSLPASYAWAKDRHYPVLYVLDGETQFEHTAAAAAFLAEQGDMPEVLVVGVRSTVRVRDFTQSDWPQAWKGGGGASHFKQFLAAELIPDINARYRSNEVRMIAGHSAGAQFVLYCLAADPGLFKAYVALAPSLDWDNRLPQRALLAAFKANPRLPAFLYVARGDDGGQALRDYDQLVNTLATAAPAQFRWHSQAFPDETHGTLPLLAQIDALRHIYPGYRLHEDLLDRGLAFAEQHFLQVSEVVGWPVAMPEQVLNNLAYTALEQQHNDQALAMFERNVAANPNSANAHDGLSDGYRQAGRWAEALTQAQRAVALAIEFDHPQLTYFQAQVSKLKARAAPTLDGAR
jgi:hypothetical protein